MRSNSAADKTKSPLASITSCAAPIISRSLLPSHHRRLSSYRDRFRPSCRIRLIRARIDRHLSSKRPLDIRALYWPRFAWRANDQLTHQLRRVGLHSLQNQDQEDFRRVLTAKCSREPSKNSRTVRLCSHCQFSCLQAISFHCQNAARIEWLPSQQFPILLPRQVGLPLRLLRLSVPCFLRLSCATLLPFQLVSRSLNFLLLSLSSSQHIEPTITTGSVARSIKKTDGITRRSSGTVRKRPAP